MIDLAARPGSVSTIRRARTALGLAGALAALTGVAEAAPTPDNAPAAAPPAAATAPAAPAAASPAAPSEAATPPAPPKAPADDDDDDDAPKPAHHDSDAAPAIPPPYVPPSTIYGASQTHGPNKSAPVPEDKSHADDGRMGTHQLHWFVSVGLRESFIANSGFDPFSTNNVLPQFSIDAGRVLYVNGPFSVAALLAFDWGSVKSNARGADTELDVARLTAGVEGRYHFWRRFYAFGRVAPGALHSSATLNDPVATVDRAANSWAFASDFSLGAAVEFAGDARGESPYPRGWLGLDGGYGFAQSNKLTLASNGDASAPSRLQPLELGELAVRGGFFRMNATITF
jgi:hypothetical protein